MSIKKSRRKECKKITAYCHYKTINRIRVNVGDACRKDSARKKERLREGRKFARTNFQRLFPAAGPRCSKRRNKRSSMITRREYDIPVRDFFF